jgi:hypothetical protein
MAGLKKLFGKKKEVNTIDSFWNWFVKNEHRFRKMGTHTNKAHVFLDELIQQMKPYNPWLKALAGPYDKRTFELIITADGDIALFCKVEELVNAAPPLKEWKITAHKPAIGMDKMSIDMFGHTFDAENMSFYPVLDPAYPDEINIVLVHPGFNEEETANFQTGGMIYLENALGELHTATMIDKYEVRGTPLPDEQIELIPLDKLENYLTWREKEFVEKYASRDASRPAESWGVLEAQDKQGKPMFSTVDAGFKNWEYVTAYPWLVQIDIDYTGNENGLPDKRQMSELQQIEDGILELLKSNTSVLFIGHHTHDNLRSIYFHSADYMAVSKIIHHYLENMVSGYKTLFFIRKDKYWQNMAFFYNAIDE